MTTETRDRASTVRPAGSWTGPAADTVELAYDERHRRRVVLTCLSGRKVLLDLAEAQVLGHGDALETGDGLLIEVRAAPERLAEIACADMGELVRVAWHLGNRHLPTQILGDRLRIREDHVIVEMVRGLGAEVTLIEAPFDPEGGAYGHGGGGHSHHGGHHHSHA